MTASMRRSSGLDDSWLGKPPKPRTTPARTRPKPRAKRTRWRRRKAAEAPRHARVGRSVIPMKLSDVLSAEAVISPLRVNGKKQALQEASVRAAAVSGLGEREI